MASHEAIRKTEIRVGAVAILGIIILIIGITLGRGVSVSTSLKTIRIHFPSASGIEYTAPVFVNGLKRGTVTSVKPDTSGVLIQVQLDDVSDLRSDAGARLTILELTGGKKIELQTGKAATAWNGQDIQGVVAPDFGDLMTFVGDISGDAKSLLRRLDTISTSLNVLLSDGTFVNDLKQTAGNANEAVASLKKILEANRENIQVSVQNLRTLSEDLKRIVKDNDAGVNDLVRKLNTAANSAQKILTSADSTLSRVDKLVFDVNDVVTQIRKGDGVVGKLIYDKEFSAHVDTTFTHLQLFLEQIREHGVNVNLRLGTRP